MVPANAPGPPPTSEEIYSGTGSLPPPLAGERWGGGFVRRFFRLDQRLGGDGLRPGCDHLGGRGLGAVAAEIGDGADRAIRLPRLADIAAVQDQPVMGAVLVVRRGHRL